MTNAFFVAQSLKIYPWNEYLIYLTTTVSKKYTYQIILKKWHPTNLKIDPTKNGKNRYKWADKSSKRTYFLGMIMPTYVRKNLAKEETH